MKIWKKVIGVIVIILFTYIYAHVAKTDAIYDSRTETADYIAAGTAVTVVEQEFVCDAKSLDGVSVKCQVAGETAGMMIRMTLTDMEDHSIKAMAELPADVLDNGKFNLFSFDKVTQCQGKRYKVTLENAGAVGFFYQPGCEKDTKLLIQGEQTEGTMIMKTVTKGFDIETFAVLLFLILYIILLFRFLIRVFSR